MPGRLDVTPLLKGVWTGLRKRRPWGDEPADNLTRWVAFGVPVAAAVIALAFGLQLVMVEELLAGAAILIGALLASFSQVATWKERLLARDRGVDGVNVRALDEAAAHILLSVLVAAVAAGSLAIASNLDLTDSPSRPVHLLIAQALSALAVAAYTYIAISLVIVVNLLWDAYTTASEPIAKAPPTADYQSPKSRRNAA